METSKPSKFFNSRQAIKSVFPKIFKNRFYFFIRWILFEFYERVTDYKIEKETYIEETGYKLDLKNPKSFTQKVVWKKIYDRNPLIPWTADKYRVREYIKSRLGEKNADKILIPLLYVSDRPESIPFNQFTDEYIVKANHRSGDVIIVEKGKKINKMQAVKKCKVWLSEPYGLLSHDWQYRKIKRKILVEQLLKDENGQLPIDYKFYVLHGKCELIFIMSGRFSEDFKNGVFLPDGRLLPVQFGKPNRISEIPKIDNYNEMIEIAECLGKDFDFVRVDLYNLKNKVFFGELTHCPAGGYLKIVPRSFDFEFGEKWDLIPDYWKAGKRK